MIGELPKLTGTSADGTNAWQELAWWNRTWATSNGRPCSSVASPSRSSWASGSPCPGPGRPCARGRRPGGVVHVRPGQHGVALVGPVPRGLPLPADSPFSRPGPALPPGSKFISAVALLLIGFSPTADRPGIRQFDRYRIDVNQGIGRPGDGQHRCRRVPGHAGSRRASRRARSTSLRAPGHRSRPSPRGRSWSRRSSCSPPCSRICPRRSSPPMIIDAVVFGINEHRGAAASSTGSSGSTWNDDSRLLGVLSAGVLLGVVIGIVLSLGWLVYVATSPSMPVLGREEGTQVYRALEEHPEDETEPRCRRAAHRRRPVLRDGRGGR